MNPTRNCSLDTNDFSLAIRHIFVPSLRSGCRAPTRSISQSVWKAQVRCAGKLRKRATNDEGEGGNDRLRKRPPAGRSGMTPSSITPVTWPRISAAESSYAVDCNDDAIPKMQRCGSEGDGGCGSAANGLGSDGYRQPTSCECPATRRQRSRCRQPTAYLEGCARCMQAHQVQTARGGAARGGWDANSDDVLVRLWKQARRCSM
jgi:hypothetical protein